MNDFFLLLSATLSYKFIRIHIHEFLTELDWFAKISGANINFEKTRQAIWFGSKM